jgi:hypothetical protein
MDWFVAVDEREEDSGTVEGWIGLSGNHQGRFRKNNGPTTIPWRREYIFNKKFICIYEPKHHLQGGSTIY